jgi:hypothetical protein
MKMLKKILFVVLGLVVAIVILAMVVPKNYLVTRSVVINAPQQQVMDEIRYFRNFTQWSPWSKLDPNMITEIKGNDGSVGAIYSWQGNEDVGKGSEEIISLAADSIGIKLMFMEPWESESDNYFTVHPKGTGTEVVWGMKGENPIPFNLMSLFMSMDKMIGKDFEEGLQNLKSRLEN